MSCDKDIYILLSYITKIESTIDKIEKKPFDSLEDEFSILSLENRLPYLNNRILINRIRSKFGLKRSIPIKNRNSLNRHHQISWFDKFPELVKLKIFQSFDCQSLINTSYAYPNLLSSILRPYNWRNIIISTNILTIHEMLMLVDYLNKDLKNIYLNFAKFKSIKLQDKLLTKLLEKIKNIQNLRLHCNSNLNIINIITTNLKQIQHLDIKWNDNKSLTNNHLKQIADNLSNLNSIVIYNAQNLQKGIVYLISKVKILKRFYIHDLYGDKYVVLWDTYGITNLYKIVTPYFSKHLTLFKLLFKNHSKTLEHLGLKEVTIDDSVLVYMMECVNLKCIDLDCTISHYQSISESLDKLNQLKYLRINFYGNEFLSENVFTNIKVQLKFLSLYGIDIDDAELLNISQCCPFLEYFCLKLSYDISDEGLKNALTNMSQLKELSLSINYEDDSYEQRRILFIFFADVPHRILRKCNIFEICVFTSFDQFYKDKLLSNLTEILNNQNIQFNLMIDEELQERGLND